MNILACVTTSEPMMLITEYCSNGDLLEFMRERYVCKFVCNRFSLC